MEELDLSGTSVGDEGCRAAIWCLGAGWAACARTLRRLSLRDCGLTSKGMDVWLHGMTVLPLPLPALRTLDLGGNAHLGDPGIECLVDGLNSLPNKQQKLFRLYNLELDGCHYSERTALFLCDRLRLCREFLPWLSELQIDHLKALPGYQEPESSYFTLQEELTGQPFLHVRHEAGW